MVVVSIVDEAEAAETVVLTVTANTMHHTMSDYAIHARVLQAVWCGVVWCDHEHADRPEVAAAGCGEDEWMRTGARSDWATLTLVGRMISREYSSLNS